MEPESGPNQWPNRSVNPFYSIEYRRSFTNLTGKPIRSLMFKITNLTTDGSRLTIANQATLRVVSSGGVGLETSGGDVYAMGTTIESPSMYSLFECCGQPFGGLNTVVSAFGGGSGPKQELNESNALSKPCGTTEVLEGEKVAVNLKVRIWNRGYYLFVVIPQVSDSSREIVQSEGFSSARACGPPSLREDAPASVR